jgi:hypothetical protein
MIRSHWKDNILFAWAGALGTFAVLKDTVKPEIISTFPEDGMTVYELNPRFTVGFQDTLSGIHGEDNYLFLLDQKRLIVEYDPEKDLGIAEPWDPLTTGLHVLKIVVRDRAGNQRTKKIRFTVQPKF